MGEDMTLLRGVIVSNPIMAVNSGGVPPSGNAPVLSPFSGGSRPQTPRGIYPVSKAPTLPITSKVGAPIYHGPQQAQGFKYAPTSPAPRPVGIPRRIVTGG